MRPLISFRIILIPLSFLILCSCQTTPRPPGTQAAGLSDMSPNDLRFVLSLLARSHDQKLQLCTLMNMPFVGAEPLAAPVFTKMREDQSALAKELADWAKKNDLDLTFQFPPDAQNQAQKRLEERQGNIILKDGRADRTRDAVVEMYMDYEWQICLLQTLLPKVHNPGLRQYLEHSLQVHEAGSAQFRDLLTHYKLS